MSPFKIIKLSNNTFKILICNNTFKTIYINNISNHNKVIQNLAIVNLRNPNSK